MKNKMKKNRMIHELLGVNSKNIQPHHDKVVQELINYNSDLELRLQIYTEYEDINGITKKEFLTNEVDTLYAILGSASALLYVYNNLEKFELSVDLHKEMKRTFCLIMNEVYHKTNNEEKFHTLLENMFNGFKEIYE